jgi:hypothetical protein
MLCWRAHRRRTNETSGWRFRPQSATLGITILLIDHVCTVMGIARNRHGLPDKKSLKATRESGQCASSNYLGRSAGPTFLKP